MEFFLVHHGKSLCPEAVDAAGFDGCCQFVFVRLVFIEIV